MQTYARGTAAGINPLMGLRFRNIFVDTVTGALHWGPLGITRHAFSLVLKGVKNTQREEAVTDFIDSIPMTSFDRVPTGDSVVGHINSFAGGDYKIVGQVGPFIARATGIKENSDTVPLFAAASTLLKLMYQAVVTEPGEHRRRLIAACNQVLTALASSPRLAFFARFRFKEHQSTHIEIHCDTYMLFIPFSCETAESTNSTTRDDVCGTNRRYPSHDLAVLNSMRVGTSFILNGGVWIDSNDGVTLHRASDQVLQLAQAPEASLLHGYAPTPPERKPGACDKQSTVRGGFVSLEH